MRWDECDLSIIIPSSGRFTLARTLESIYTSGFDSRADEVLVRINGNSPWGHGSRNLLMAHAKGTHLMFMDDDDVYEPGALTAVREAISAYPDRVHIFQMRYSNGHVLWSTKELREGNVSTQMVVTPNIKEQLGRWGSRYEGDYDFIKETCAYQGDPVWHQFVIASVRP
jgi:hypothetical protein